MENITQNEFSIRFEKLQASSEMQIYQNQDLRTASISSGVASLKYCKMTRPAFCRAARTCVDCQQSSRVA